MAPVTVRGMQHLLDNSRYTLHNETITTISHLIYAMEHCIGEECDGPMPEPKDLETWQYCLLFCLLFFAFFVFCGLGVFLKMRREDDERERYRAIILAAADSQMATATEQAEETESIMEKIPQKYDSEPTTTTHIEYADPIGEESRGPSIPPYSALGTTDPGPGQMITTMTTTNRPLMETDVRNMVREEIMADRARDLRRATWSEVLRRSGGSVLPPYVEHVEDKAAMEPVRES